MGWIRGFKNHVLKCDQRYLFGIFAIGTLFGFYLILHWFALNTLTGQEKSVAITNTLRYFAALFTVCAILLATIQFKATNEWNRRQFALKASREAWNDMSGEQREILNKAFKYSERKTSYVIPLEEVHKKICKVDTQGNLMSLPEHPTRYCLDAEGEGHKIFITIHKRLGSLEYLASGVKFGVFDKQIVKDLLNGIFIKNYNHFSAYIQHQQEENPGVFENLEWLAKGYIETEATNRKAKGPKDQSMPEMQ